MITELPVIDQIKGKFPIVYVRALSADIVKAVKMQGLISMVKKELTAATVGKSTSFAVTLPVCMPIVALFAV